jgi:pyrroloquinoline quinone (PQQ) biosynthesis protein C
VADTVWGLSDACVAGSNAFYGNKDKRVADFMRLHEVSRGVDVEEAWKGLDVHTGENVVPGGDSVMLP